MRSKFKWIFTLLLAFTMQFSFAQEKTITGVVTDASGPLPGVNVVVKGTQRGVQTNFDGSYSIKAKEGETLVYSFLGMNETTRVVGATTVISVKLQDNTQILETVVVEGYRNTTKSTTTVAQTTIKAKTIENRPNASFVQTLQGQVAGLNISSGSGQPGAKSTVIIRGLGSLNGNSDPLYVIDGMPTNGDNFRSINPSDIESATVLKDASATAVYGNRGANGVIVVKTKRGGTSGDKVKFRYSGTTGLVQLQKSKYDYANSRQNLDLELEMFGAVNFSPVTGLDYTDAVNTDWNDYFFETAHTSDHQFSVETQGKNVSSYTSLSYLDQRGVLKSTGLKRFTFRNNLNGKSSDDKFNYSTGVSIGFSKNNEATNLGTGAINQNYVIGAMQSLPYLSPSEYTGSQDLFDMYQANGTLLYTPLFLIDKLKTFTNDTNETRIIGTTEFSYKLFKDLTARTRTSGELNIQRLVQSQHPISFNSFLFLDPAAQFNGFEDINNRREFYFNHLWQLDYKKVIAEKHTVNLLLNSEYNFQQLNANNVRQRGLDPRTFVPGAGTGYLADVPAHDFYGPQATASKLKNNLISYFGILDYDFDGKYGVTGSYRFDGSSKFGPQRQWGEFWSVGGRWNVTSESFMKNQSLFQLLKVRGSYGETGNQRIVDGSVFAGNIPPGFVDNYVTSATAGNTYNGQSVLVPNFGYQDLHWEVTKQSNIGLDFELYKSRVRGNVDFYNKKTVDLFNIDPVSPVSGTAQLNKNSDITVVNKGVELNLAYDLVKNDNFKFTLRGNGAYNKNKVDGIKLNDGKIINGNVITQNGGQVSEFYTIPYAGVNPLNGNLLFVSANGTLTETPSIATDRVSTGKSENPVYVGGFGFDADYKGFFASTNFTYAQKLYRFDFDLEGLYDPNSIGQFVVSPDLLNAWTPTNTDSNVPSLNATNLGTGTNDSDRFLKDASYVRLRYLQVGYRVPKKFLEHTFLTDASFSLQGENLVTFTKWKGFDAESDRAADQGQYPTPRIYTFGVDIRF
ncbi:SusC/RagA family TonB-linked outer membrane protein [Flavobacterium sp.]|uniref:SusC/RagA family TonB-linked outer membrane protein n=1 Tax=Flavobacterium sp. TaxID=239 RepID=UPI003D6AAE0F